MQTTFPDSVKSVRSKARKLATAVRFKAIMAEHGPHHKGYIAALNDPVGMTNDLSELTMPDLQAGFDEKMHQSRMIADLLAITEKSVRKEAREDVEFSDNVAEISATFPDGDTYNSAKTVFAVIKAGGPRRYAEQQKEKRKKYGADLAGRQQAAEDEAWYDLTHDNGRPTLMTLYVLNGLSGIGIAFAAYYSIAAIWAPLLIASFAISVSIAVVNNSQLKTWISRCEFSLGEKYSSFEDQMKAFNQIAGI